MQLVEFEAVSEQDTYALVTGTKAPDTDNTKKVIGMCRAADHVAVQGLRCALSERST
jgi:hypothetical protein